MAVMVRASSDGPAFPFIRTRYAVRVKSFSTAFLAFALVSCEPADNDPGPGGVTAGEARALDEAAEMLDEPPADGEEADDT